MNRRDALKNTLLGVGASLVVPAVANIGSSKTNYLTSVKFPDLPYGYNELEQFIDASSLETLH